MLAFGPIEAIADHKELAADLADDLLTALTRAGVAVAGPSRTARYQLTGAIRGSGPQTHLTFRLIDTETGGQLWAHRSDGILCDQTASGEQLAARIASALQPCLRMRQGGFAVGIAVLGAVLTAQGSAISYIWVFSAAAMASAAGLVAALVLLPVVSKK